jgi:hypothetical protein
MRERLDTVWGTSDASIGSLLTAAGRARHADERERIRVRFALRQEESGR